MQSKHTLQSACSLMWKHCIQTSIFSFLFRKRFARIRSSRPSRLETRGPQGFWKGKIASSFIVRTFVFKAPQVFPLVAFSALFRDVHLADGIECHHAQDKHCKRPEKEGNDRVIKRRHRWPQACRCTLSRHPGSQPRHKSCAMWPHRRASEGRGAVSSGHRTRS